MRGVWTEGEGLRGMCDCKLHWLEDDPMRLDIRGQSLKVELTTIHTSYHLKREFSSELCMVSQGLVPDVMSSLRCFKKIDSTFLSSGVSSDLMEIWGC